MLPGRGGGFAWALQLVLCSMLVMTGLPRTILLAEPQPATAGFRGPHTALADAVRVAPQQVKAGALSHVTIDLKLPTGYLLTPRAPLTYRVALSGAGIHITDVDRRFNRIAPSLPLQLPFQAAPGRHQSTLDIDLTFAYCRKDNTGVCAMQSVRWLVPLHTTPDGVSVSPVVLYNVEAPEVQK